jgi:Flp pilus assembly protein TadG
MKRFQFLFRRGRRIRTNAKSRRGVVLVVFAVLLIALLGMVGLVVDGANLASGHRQTQNAADAAALAAAMDRMRGRTMQEATTTANTFVVTHNGLTNATSEVNSPPSSGPYAGQSSYVEVIVTYPMTTYIAHVVGFAQNQTVTARAVAGYEAHSAGEGVAVLNPNAKPGVAVNGAGSILRVNGRINVNSGGGGMDEFGATVLDNSGANGTVAANGNPSGIYATDFRIVGGVDDRTKFYPYDSGDTLSLHCRELEEPDPLLELPTPYFNNGVDSRVRGDVSVTNNNITGLDSDSALQNHVATAGESVAGGLYTATAGEVILYPGVYRSLSITGGKVYFIPGIYVISPNKNVQNAFQINGGTVVARKVLFYNTSVSYNPSTGSPDSGDREDSTPLPNTEFAGSFQINAGMQFSPIDTTAVNYASLYSGARPVSSDFDGMLFYQRRRHQSSITIAGNAADGALAGTLYAKWSRVTITGQGTYNAQFIVGSILVNGNGNVTVLSAGGARGRAHRIYLVE